MFELTPDGYLYTSGTTIDGEETVEPSPSVTPTGTNGVVDSQVITMPAGLMDRLRVITRAEYHGPYNYILEQLGQTDDEGWRKIWGYYSSRSIEQILIDFKNKGHILVEQNTTSLTNYKTWTNTENYLTTNYKTWNDTQNYLTTNYKNWSDTKNYLDNNYKKWSDTQTYLNNNYKTWNDTQNSINTQFGITSSDKFKKQQITVDGVSYTVLVSA